MTARASAGVDGTAGLRGRPVAQCHRCRIVIGNSLLRGSRRQRCQIGCDGLDIAVRKVRRGVVDNIGHRSEGRTDSVVAMLEKLGDVLRRPGTEAGPHVAAKTWRRPSVELRSGEKVRAAIIERLFLHADAARGVAGAAMTRALDQIGAAIPDGVMVWLCDIASARREEEIPERKRPAQAE